MNEPLRKALAARFGSRLHERDTIMTVAPASERELSLLLELLREHRCGLHRGVELSRAAFSHLGSVELKGGIVEAGAGVRVDTIENALRAQGLSLGLMSPGVRSLELAQFIEGPCRGLRAIQGGRLESVALALRGIMPTGERYASHPSPRSATGPDLDALYAGAAGRLGLVTSALLRSVAAPTHARTAAFSFPSPQALIAALLGALAEGCRLDRARAVHAERIQLELTWVGTSQTVDADEATLGQYVFSAGGRPSSPLPHALSLAGREVGEGLAHAPSSKEREANWAAVRAALDAGAALALYRLSIDAAVVRGEVQGTLLAHESSWTASREMSLLATAMDPDGVLGGVP